MRIEQDANGFEGARGKDNGSGVDLYGLAAVSINEAHSRGSAVFVQGDFGDHCVGDYVELSARKGGR
jgi:hypothetical protein